MQHKLKMADINSSVEVAAEFIALGEFLWDTQGESWLVFSFGSQLSSEHNEATANYIIGPNHTRLDIHRHNNTLEHNTSQPNINNYCTFMLMYFGSVHYCTQRRTTEHRALWWRSEDKRKQTLTTNNIQSPPCAPLPLPSPTSSHLCTRSHSHSALDIRRNKPVLRAQQQR